MPMYPNISRGDEMAWGGQQKAANTGGLNLQALLGLLLGGGMGGAMNNRGSQVMNQKGFLGGARNWGQGGKQLNWGNLLGGNQGQEQSLGVGGTGGLRYNQAQTGGIDQNTTQGQQVNQQALANAGNNYLQSLGTTVGAPSGGGTGGQWTGSGEAGIGTGVGQTGQQALGVGGTGGQLYNQAYNQGAQGVGEAGIGNMLVGNKALGGAGNQGFQGSGEATITGGNAANTQQAAAQTAEQIAANRAAALGNYNFGLKADQQQGAYDALKAANDAMIAQALAGAKTGTQGAYTPQWQQLSQQANQAMAQSQQGGQTINGNTYATGVNLTDAAAEAMKQRYAQANRQLNTQQLLGGYR